MHGRRLVVGLVFVVAILATACQPTFVSTTPSTPCYVGTFTLKGAHFPSAIKTPAGPETLSITPGGSVTLTTTNGTWDLTVSEQITASGNFTGTATVQAEASGTFTATDTTLDFTVTSLSGSVHITGDANGHPVDMNVNLPGSFLDAVIGLQGTATYACPADGLSLVFTSFSLDF